jgi:beta-lactamase class A
MNKMRTCLLLLPALLAAELVSAQSTDKKLDKLVRQAVTGFHGSVGVYIKYLPTGKTVELNADSLFPTASMVKLPILFGIMQKINHGELSYHQTLIYRDSLLYAGEDILGSFKDREQIALSKLLMLMLSTSDNTASLWLQSLAGSGTTINALLDSLGYHKTRVNSRTPGRETDRDIYGWGQTTPREMAMFFEKIWHRQMLNPAASDRMLRLLGRNYWDEEALSQIPPYIFVACKNGAVDASRSESMLVMAPHGAYLLSVITKNQTDTRWDSDNEGWVLARRLSGLLYHYYEPNGHYQPQLGTDGNPTIKRKD